MKKIFITLLVGMLICTFIGCGKETEPMSVENKNEEGETITVEFEKAIADGSGKQVFGYNVPLGWRIIEEKKDSITIGRTMQSYVYPENNFTLELVKNKQMIELYDTGTIENPENGLKYAQEGLVETPFGEFKLFYGSPVSEFPEYEYGELVAVLKIDDKNCLTFKSNAEPMGLYKATDGWYFLEMIEALLEEKMSENPLNMEYNQKFVGSVGDATDQLLLTFNASDDWWFMDLPGQSVNMERDGYSIAIYEREYCQNAGSSGSCTEKESAETSYGTVAIYELPNTLGSGNETYEIALMRIGGNFICISELAYAGSEKFELKDILENELFK